MPAYVILNIDVSDPDLFEAYKQLAPATIAAYGGKYLARGGKAEALEGDLSSTVPTGPRHGSIHRSTVQPGPCVSRRLHRTPSWSKALRSRRSV